MVRHPRRTAASSGIQMIRKFDEAKRAEIDALIDSYPPGHFLRQHYANVATNPNETYEGFMAQDVQKKWPEAVKEIDGALCIVMGHLHHDHPLRQAHRRLIAEGYKVHPTIVAFEEANGPE